MNARLLFINALSPLHAGTGQGIGVIDLPIAREKATDLPFLPGSSLKGALRDACASTNIRDRIFGPSAESASEYASSVQFSDQRLLLLPVRSIAGTFAWVTSPYLLRRLLRDARDVGVNGVPAHVPGPQPEQAKVATQASHIVVKQASREKGKTEGEGTVILEDLDLKALPSSDVEAWAKWVGASVFPADETWQQLLVDRFCVVHDDVLNFLLQTSTQITARIKLLDDTKTVKSGGLWYEESLPAETILSGLVLATPIKASAQEVFDTVSSLTKSPLQLGGKATVGRGLCRLQLMGAMPPC